MNSNETLNSSSLHQQSLIDFDTSMVNEASSPRSDETESNGSSAGVDDSKSKVNKILFY